MDTTSFYFETNDFNNIKHDTTKKVKEDHEIIIPENNIIDKIKNKNNFED